MIVFDLKCEQNHQFESWFRSSEAYSEQLAAGLVECPYCGSLDVGKAVMAPNVGVKGNQNVQEKIAHAGSPEEPVASAAMAASSETRELAKKATEAIAKFQAHVEKSCENVGENFAEEARKIHYGESEERGIYGETSIEEAQELLEEGVDVMPLPGVRRTDT